LIHVETGFTERAVVYIEEGDLFFLLDFLCKAVTWRLCGCFCRTEPQSNPHRRLARLFCPRG
jgi:hypothetical protein